MNKIQEGLFKLQDAKYGDFTAKLIPTLDRKTIIGVRAPALRKYAKEISGSKEAKAFIKRLPHKYLEENGVHSALIGNIKDFNECIEEVERFLPYVDNWATCDSLLPEVFSKHKKELLKHIKTWIKSDHVYTVRFAIGMLMKHFLDDDFDEKYLKMVSRVKSDEYYTKMMIAWYFATALAKQYETTFPYIENMTLDSWTHNKAIQKSVESYRITDEQKETLKKFRINRSRVLARRV